MRKLLIIGFLSSVAFSSAANAQSEREIRKDEKAVAVQQEQLVEAQDRGNTVEIEKARAELHGAHQELREDRRDQRTSQYKPPYRDWSQSTPALGSNLRPKFYGKRYVISNTNHYSLSPVARDQRWIRYGDDILLVNVRSGRVDEVLPRRYRDM